MKKRVVLILLAVLMTMSTMLVGCNASLTVEREVPSLLYAKYEDNNMEFYYPAIWSSTSNEGVIFSRAGLGGDNVLLVDLEETIPSFLMNKAFLTPLLKAAVAGEDPDISFNIDEVTDVTVGESQLVMVDATTSYQGTAMKQYLYLIQAGGTTKLVVLTITTSTYADLYMTVLKSMLVK